MNIAFLVLSKYQDSSYKDIFLKKYSLNTDAGKLTHINDFEKIYLKKSDKLSFEISIFLKNLTDIAPKDFFKVNNEDLYELESFLEDVSLIVTYNLPKSDKNYLKIKSKIKILEIDSSNISFSELLDMLNIKRMLILTKEDLVEIYILFFLIALNKKNKEILKLIVGD
ncbi:hypothetical protein [Fusobacterium polymorphum]|uniref:hypothetical protein n=1 Tax=Fusobacterium nucleatum subsp. polymorphum TaxID=76857 RepID=UPI0030092FFF